MSATTDTPLVFGQFWLEPASQNWRETRQPFLNNAESDFLSSGYIYELIENCSQLYRRCQIPPGVKIFGIFRPNAEDLPHYDARINQCATELQPLAMHTIIYNLNSSLRVTLFSMGVTERRLEIVV